MLCVSLVKGEGGGEGSGEGGRPAEGEEGDTKQARGTYFYCELYPWEISENFFCCMEPA